MTLHHQGFFWHDINYFDGVVIFWISSKNIVLINKETTRTQKHQQIGQHKYQHKSEIETTCFEKATSPVVYLTTSFLYIEDTKTRLDINTMLHLHSNLLHSSFANWLKRQYQTNISDESKFIFFWAEFVLDIKISIIIHFTYNRTIRTPHTKMRNFDSK